MIRRKNEVNQEKTLIHLKMRKNKQSLEDYIDELNRRHDEEQKKLGRRVKNDESNLHANLSLADKEIVKELPWFEPSGILAEETNKINGVVLKFTEPLDAEMPDKKWRLYWFKGEEELPTLYIHRQTWFLIGRDIRVCDIHCEHESISGQHAVIQYRQYKYMNEEGELIKEVQ